MTTMTEIVDEWVEADTRKLVNAPSAGIVFPGVWLVALVLLAMPLLDGCVIRSHKEVVEALALAKTLYRIQPEAQELQQRERVAANELKIILEETYSITLPTSPNKITHAAAYNRFQQKIKESFDKIRIIIERRRQLQEKIRQGVWETPLSHLVQENAVARFQEDLIRDETWVQLAKNLRLRQDLGREQEYPELQTLFRQLELF